MRRGVVPALACLALCAACGSSEEKDETAGAGGQATSGGAGASAGSKASGGTKANGSGAAGGSSNTGGEDASGGAGAGGPANGSGGVTSTGGANTGGGANTSGTNTGGNSMTKSGLPVPPGAADVAKPSGAAANLKVVPWAGFTAAATYTFDDSQPSQFEHWPELKATGARVTYYITTANSYIAGYEATLKELAAMGGEIGNHTVHHCNADLSNCAGAATPEASVNAELDVCTSYITKLGEPDTLTIAYPYGDVAYTAASKTRFFLGRGVGAGMIGMGDQTDPFNLPIFSAAGGEGASVFSAQIDTALAQKKWVIFLFHSLAPTTSAWYATVDIGAVTGSIAHAQSLNGVWLDTLANVGAYWLSASLVKGAGPTWNWTLPPHFPTGKYLRVKVDGGTLKQAGEALKWDPHGYYEVALDAGTLSWSP